TPDTATPTAGTAFNLTVAGTDPYGNAVSNYLGRVHFASSDARATIPADYTFVRADGGSHAFPVTLRTAGSQTITATDTSNPDLTATQPFRVAAGPLATFSLAGVLALSPQAGKPYDIAVSAKDASGNTVSSYTG